MLRQNIFFYFRTLLKDKKSLIVNVLGISTGLICFLLSSLYVNYLLSWDKFHENKDRLYQVVKHDFNGAAFMNDKYMPFPLGPAALDAIPEIENVVTTTSDDAFFLSHEQSKLKVFGEFVSKDFFNVFTYKVLDGKKSNILDDRQSIAITSKLALKLFNRVENVAGEVIKVKGLGDFTVSSVYELPENTYDIFEFVLPMSFFTSKSSQVVNDWSINSFKTYFLVKDKDTDIKVLNSKLTALINSKYDNKTAANQKLTAVPYVDIGFGANYDNGEYTGGALSTIVNLIFFMALGILIIALINYINIATARALSRMKEIGVKKAMGASKKQLIIQFFTEIFVLTVISVVLSVIIAKLLTPAFGNLVDAPLVLEFNLSFFLFVIGVILFIVLFAGSYPAFYLSSFKPVNALRGTIKGSFIDLFSRKGLVLFQFIISVILVVFVLAFQGQIAHMLNRDVGHENKNIIAIEASGELVENTDTYLTQLKELPGVIEVSSMLDGFYNTSLYGSISWDGKPEEQVIPFNLRRVNNNFIEMADIKLEKGRSFNKERDKIGSKAIVNPLAAAAMNMKNPIGKVITFRDEEVEIIGVTNNNLHLLPAFQQTMPLVFLNSADANTVVVKVNPSNVDEVLLGIKNFSTTFNPEYPFEYKFLEDDYLRNFENHFVISKLAIALAIIAMIICCLGLYGLTAYSIEKRKKEIGVKKALGSGNTRIFNLLVSGFSKIILIALVVGFVLSYFLVNILFEDNFSYRISLNVWYFLAASFIIIFAALSAIGVQMNKVLKISPVDYLREE